MVPEDIKSQNPDTTSLSQSLPVNLHITRTLLTSQLWNNTQSHVINLSGGKKENRKKNVGEIRKEKKKIKYYTKSPVNEQISEQRYSVWIQNCFSFTKNIFLHNVLLCQYTILSVVRAVINAVLSLSTICK